MRPQRHLVLLVKAPRLGAVKTRLAVDIGMLKAWRFHRASVAGTLRRLGRDPRWRCWLLVTPDRFARPGRPWPPHLARRPQGGGDLGARMGRALNSMPPGPVVIIGGDIPEIEPGDIVQAFRELSRKDMVFGPSSDGGYWLIGARRRPPPRGLFQGVRWSSPFALADTLANLGAHCRTALLREHDDIDDGDDYRRWRARIKAAPRRRWRATWPG